jgi:hypothetical protein
MARSAVGIDGIQSAAVFRVIRGGADPGLVLVGAAGIDGPPLDGLIAAVANPAHPIRRAVTDAGPTFDVAPLNPGGPRLRSHLPVRAPDGTTRGVLAVAHDAALDGAARSALETLADTVITEDTR